MARSTFTANVGSAGGNNDKFGAVSTANATVAADTDVIASGTAPAKVTAVDTALTAARNFDAVVDINLATVTSMNKLDALLADLRAAIKASGQVPH